jgi:hypothetical protein
MNTKTNFTGRVSESILRVALTITRSLPVLFVVAKSRVDILTARKRRSKNTRPKLPYKERKKMNIKKVIEEYISERMQGDDVCQVEITSVEVENHVLNMIKESGVDDLDPILVMPGIRNYFQS